MKNKFLKVFAIILAFMMMLMAFASCGMPIFNGVKEGLAFYLLPDGTYGVKLGTTKYMENIVIPATYNGKAVTQILPKAFQDADNLKSITIPDSVTSIGEDAFYNCSKLMSVTIGNSVTSIGARAFLLCRSLTSVTIPDSVTSIGEDAFLGCSSLTSVTIPDSVMSIGEDAFSGCSNLKYNEYNNGKYLGNSRNPYIILVGVIDMSATSFTISNTTKFIHSSAFRDRSSFTSVTIPDSVTSIGERAFYDCDSLTSITIPDSVTSIGEDAFSHCSSLTSVIIPDSVMSISDGAFYNTGYYNNESNWENGVLYIGKYLIESKNTITGAYTVKSGTNVIANSAFESCEDLTSVTIPDSVKSIGDYAFRNCSSLTSITIPDSVKSIGSSAFYYCSELTNVTIGNSVTSIGHYAFSSCSSLTSVEFKNTEGWIADSTAISSADLANTSTAATYLKSTYCYYDWTRS